MEQKRSFVFDTKKSGALVLGADRLEDYAEKYLTQRFPEALQQPMALPVDQILEHDGLTVVETGLSENLDVFACCLLVTGEVRIYDRASETWRIQRFPAGTILVDPLAVSFMGPGGLRNTLVHEALHWEKDRRFFEIRELKSGEMQQPILCRRSRMRYQPPQKGRLKKHELEWLEWQVHRLAPRVLMPYAMFRKKAQELLHEGEAPNKNPDAVPLPTCDELVDALSNFFQTSRTSVKYRLLEVGLEDDMKHCPDFQEAFVDIRESKDFTQLSFLEAVELLSRTQVLRSWVSSEHLRFVDGYFVAPEKKNFKKVDGKLHLSANAKKNLSRCVLNIRTIFYPKENAFAKELADAGGLCYAEGAHQRLLTFSPEYQDAFQSAEDKLDDISGKEAGAFQAFADALDDGDDALEDALASPRVSLCTCLSLIMVSKHWDAKIFVDRTLLNRNYYSKIDRDEANRMNKPTLWAMCVGLGLSVRTIMKLFGKAKACKLDEYELPDKIYLRMIEKDEGISIDDFNEICKLKHLPLLGSQSGM